LSIERFQDFSFGVRAAGVTFEELQETTAVRLVVFSQGASTREFASAIESLGLQGVTYSVGYNNAGLDVAGRSEGHTSELSSRVCPYPPLFRSTCPSIGLKISAPESAQPV